MSKPQFKLTHCYYFFNSYLGLLNSVAATVTNCNNYDYITSHGWAAVKSKTYAIMSTNWFCRFVPQNPVTFLTVRFTERCPSWRKQQCSGKQINTVIRLVWVCERMNAQRILLLTVTLVSYVLYPVPNTVSLVTKSTVNTRASNLKAGIWLISECMIAYIKVKQISANSLTDRYAWRA